MTGNKTTTRCTLFAAPLALLLAGGANLSAQDKPWRFGLTGAFALPTASDFDVTNAGVSYSGCLSSGFSIGANIEWELNRTNAIRAKAEYLTFAAKDSLHSYDYFYDIPNATGTINCGLSGFAIGADYIYSFDSNDSGGYLLAGLGYYITNSSGTNKITAAGYSGTATINLKGSGNALGLSLGTGFRFTPNFACELKFGMTSGLKHKVDETLEGLSTQENVDVTLSWLSLGINYRF
jgi:hypothetical protein